MTKKQRKISLPRSVSRLFPNVTSAVDANDSIELSVNKKDCSEARRLDPTDCAMARAAKRELHADAAIIGLSTSYIIKGDTAYRYATPNSVRSEIVSFDRHHDFAAGDYYLNPKSESAKFGNPSNWVSRGNRGGGGHKARRKIHHSARVRILSRGSDHK